jgi:RHS repeat-associated protein
MKSFFRCWLWSFFLLTFSAHANFIAPTYSTSGTYTVDWTYTGTGSCNGGSYIYPFKIQELSSSGQVLREVGLQTKPFNVQSNPTGNYTYKLWTYTCSSSGGDYYYRGAVTVQVNPKPSVPNTFVATLTAPSISLTWTAPPQPMGYYQLQRNGVAIATPSAGATSFTDSNPVEGSNTYTLRACTTSSSGCSDPKTSNTVTVTSQVPVGNLSPELTNGVVSSVPVTSEPTSFVGSIGGEFRVNESGAATYRIPLRTPDGVAGVRPQVNIGYSSQDGNGLLGRGWSLGGLGSISRCRQTLSQDGQALPITWSAADRFCLDGQRLMLVSGTYGAPGSVYKTEIETFVTVTAVGGSSGHPDYFTVVAKDGSTSTYGSLGSSLSEMGTASGVVSWHISKFEDSTGNPIHYVYEGSLSEGARIKEIYYAYGANKNISNYNARLVFTYENRNDWLSGYLAGYSFANTRRLKKITGYNGSQVFREYTLNYDYAPAPTGSYSRLKSVQECADSAGLYCYPVTSFSWYQNASTNFATTLTNRTLRTGTSAINAQTFMDINANGVLDYVWSEVDNFGLTRVNYLLDPSNSSTSQTKSLFNYSNTSAQAPKFHVIDYNGDARQDLMVYDDNAKKWKLYLASPGHDGWSLQYHSELPFVNGQVIVGDMNSDGLTDVAQVNGSDIRFYHLQPRPGAASTSDTYYQFSSPVTYAFVGGPASSPIPNFSAGFLNAQNVTFGDFNGDGKVDLVLNVSRLQYSAALGRNVFYAEFRAYVANTSGQFEYYATLVGHSEGETVVLEVNSADINGDGLSDVIYKRASSKRWYYRLSTGTGFADEVFLSEIPAELASTGQQEPTLVDMDRDGHADIVWRQVRSGYSTNPMLIKYWDSKTSTFKAAQVLEGTTSNDTTYLYMDANGDTWVDRVVLGKSAGANTLTINRNSGGTAPDVMYGITDGLGNYTSISYELLSQSSNYSPIGDIKITGETSYACTPQYSYNMASSPPVTIIGETCSNQTSYTVNKNEFYRQINAPFAGLTNNNLVAAPVLETIGAIPIVTKATSTAHATSAGAPGSAASKTSSITYYYKHLRMQAAGRGMLGFAELKTVDMQTGVVTETKYRQDWPYIGSPAETLTKTHDGQLLSSAVNSWNRKTYATSTSKRYQPYIEKTVEKSYAWNSDGSVGTSPLQTVTTNTALVGDEYGNVSELTVTTEGSGQTLVQKTVNEYGTSAWEKQMGRLKSTTVTTTRNGVADTARKVSFEYHTAAPHKGLLWKEIVAEGTADQLVTAYSYDAFGNKTEVAATGKSNATDTVTRKTTYAYDTDGRYLVSSSNNLNHVVSTTERHPVTGAPTKVKDANEVEGQVYYDKMGREYLRQGATGAWSRTDVAACGTFVGETVYCPSGARYYQLTRVAGGGKSVQYYDGVGRVLRSAAVGFDGRWINTDSEYDVLGRLVHQSTPYFDSSSPVGWTTYQYDRLGRVLSVKMPDGSMSYSSYSGYDTTITNALQQSQAETRNGLGQLVGVRDNLGGTISYTYNAKGALLTATTDDSPSASPNVAPVTVTMCYDLLGRKTAMHDPDKGGFKTTGAVSCSNIGAGWWQYKYNAFGELIEQTSPAGSKSVMTYDLLGRMVTRKDFKGSTLDANTAWFYDAPLGGSASASTRGKLTAVIMNKTNSSIANATSSCGGTNHCVKTSYDLKGRPVTTTTRFSDGSSFSNTVKYDSIGRAYEVRDALQALFTHSGVQTQYNQYGFAYRTVDVAPRDGTRGVFTTILEMNERGQVTRETRGNGAVTVNTYDPYTGLLKKQQASVTGLLNIQNNTYDWDVVGNLKSRITLGAKIGSTSLKSKEEGFCYDGLNRLIATLPSRNPSCGGTPDIKYDGLGNITYKKGVGNYTYDRVNGGAHAVTSVNGAVYRYDANGNVTSGDGRNFEYTSYDLASKITKGSDSVQFEYGPDRSRWQRIDKKGSVTTTTLYIGNIERISASNSNIVEWKRNVEGAVHTYRTVNNQLQANGSDKKYIYVDHLGSSDVITDGIGRVTHSMSFDAWGARRSGEDWSAQTLAQSFERLSLAGFTQPITKRGFTGHEMVDDMGIIHMNGRIYDARIARFLQADPFIQASTNTQSFNRYAYVLNNPLNAVDPSGFFFKKLWKAIKPFVGAIVSIIVAVVCPPCGMVVAGMIGGAVGAAVNGGNILKGALYGAIGGAAASAGLFASAMWGGIQSEIEGGSFGHGFLAAGIGAMGGGDSSGWTGFVKAAVIGGVATEITGGKFKNGAAGAAFMYAMAAGVQKIAAGGKQNANSEGKVEYFDKDKDSVEFSYDERVKLRENLNAQRDELIDLSARARGGDSEAIALIKKYVGNDMTAFGAGVKELSTAVDKFETYKFQKLYAGDGSVAATYNPGDGIIRLSKTVFDNVMSGRTDYALIHEIGHFAGFGHGLYDGTGSGRSAAITGASVSNYRGNYRNSYAYEALLMRY